ncbi:hypothetical protein [Streptomyces sp. NPDC016845]|uniref:hypothetical protein n=1 Tax=Streptomyces sp. NPDC016845 TaxID=3364972 RepID=UPI00378A2C91
MPDKGRNALCRYGSVTVRRGTPARVDVIELVAALVGERARRRSDLFPGFPAGGDPVGEFGRVLQTAGPFLTG